MNFINFLIVKMLVKTKFANIINIAAKKEIIPELLQGDCNPKNISSKTIDFLDNPERLKEQIKETQLILKSLKSTNSSAFQAGSSLNKFL